MLLQISTHIYRPVKFLSHTEEKMFKKRPAICCCLHVNICDLIWPQAVFQQYKWRNSCVEHESEVIPVISEILYSVMHSCQTRLLQQSADKLSGKQITIIHNTIVFSLLAEFGARQVSIMVPLILEWLAQRRNCTILCKKLCISSKDVSSKWDKQKCKHTTVKAYEWKEKIIQFAVTQFVNERYVEQLRQSTK